MYWCRVLSAVIAFALAVGIVQVTGESVAESLKYTESFAAIGLGFDLAEFRACWKQAGTSRLVKWPRPRVAVPLLPPPASVAAAAFPDR